MAFTLRVTSGAGEGQSLECDDEVVIGRENADLTVADDEASRAHASVRPVSGGVAVKDLSSLNGTFVDGKRIDREVTLTVGATIRVGQTEIAIELPVPEITVARQVPSDLKGIDPDVTVARQVPSDLKGFDPDVTAPRSVPAPDVTAPRGVPAPEVTAPRAAEPAPSETEPSEGPPGTPPPARYSSGRSGGKGGSGGPPPAARIAAIVVGLIVAVVILLLLLG